MKRTIRKMRLKPETVRTLTTPDLRGVVGGMRGTTSEADGAGPCPGEYSWTCSP